MRERRTSGRWRSDRSKAWEKADRDLAAARARRSSAAAEVGRLEALAAKTVITAPIDGVVVARHVHAGETIAAGDAIVTVMGQARRRPAARDDTPDDT